MRFLCPPAHFDQLADGLGVPRRYHRPDAGDLPSRKRHFHALFGCSAYICSMLWEYLAENRNILRGAKPVHLLWALLFLKLYNNEEASSLICGCTRKTFRQWVWIVIGALSKLHVVRYLCSRGECLVTCC